MYFGTLCVFCHGGIIWLALNLINCRTKQATYTQFGGSKTIVYLTEDYLRTYLTFLGIQTTYQFILTFKATVNASATSWKV
jgi:hypothetical protein